MRGQKKAPAGTGAGAAALAANLAANRTTHPEYSIPEPARQPLAGAENLLDLAAQALALADRAAVLAQACQAAGDRAGFLHWRRQLLAHQAIYFEAMHPTPWEAIA